MIGLDLTLIVLYLSALVALSLGRRVGGGVDYLLAGRRLSLPGFVASLVATWYGGILGVGEYAYLHGVSTWLVFGVPYYLAAVVFALVIAPRLRATSALSIPDLLLPCYGRAVGRLGGAGVLALSLPVAYVLMLSVLLSQVTGWSTLACTVLATAFSAFYVGLSGFRAVVRTDVLQFALMFSAFLLLLPFALARLGGIGALWSALPATHTSWDGGLGWQAVLVWYLIAFQTVVDPAFYQRVFAARSPAVARAGVLVSVVLWAVFDLLTVFSGLAARVLLPDLADPLATYPALAAAVLPPVLRSLFVVGLVATVMSTLDSYLFLAAATFSHDLLPTADPLEEKRRTRWGLAVSATLAGAGALLFDSVVTVWHHVGSVVTSALLVPVVAVHLPPGLRPRPLTAGVAMVSAAATAAGWILLRRDGRYPLQLEPMLPALTAALACWAVDLVVRRLAPPAYNPPPGAP